MIITMNAQQRMQITADAKKPDSCVTAGIASIPAPTCNIFPCIWFEENYDNIMLKWIQI